ncbi:GNAT family N-acetyltransferase [Saccharothrix violaceirubra]|uniref:GNAT superfamily N-acetyltransferase n=1 Tax=Saccharothrix violaceirubra TaxID=413306 RepID=A0A7W7WU64_9PSEU|nr:GNAT family N-acetyltransferase [Saccharothrix violaceirubra]MBB4963889.1 GNAT superfamily N-acetyltransferase [Saccharothrix violaceirubra]
MRPYDHPDSVKLIAELQQLFVVRYGEADATVVDPAQFAAPAGHFLVGYVDGVPVACGGWRAREEARPPLLAGDAEIKRMYVVDSARGKGYARLLLAALEQAARDAGRTRLVLETGDRQPEAIALYESSGYTPMAGFGHYKDEPGAHYFAKVL